MKTQGAKRAERREEKGGGGESGPASQWPHDPHPAFGHPLAAPAEEGFYIGERVPGASPRALNLRAFSPLKS